MEKMRDCCHSLGKTLISNDKNKNMTYFVGDFFSYVIGFKSFLYRYDNLSDGLDDVIIDDHMQTTLEDEEAIDAIDDI